MAIKFQIEVADLGCVQEIMNALEYRAKQFWLSYPDTSRMLQHAADQILYDVLTEKEGTN
jgi:hypothetical protein